MPPAELVFILVRPQLGENIGMAARAMLNFGLSQLRIVAPRDGWGANTPVMQAARDAAVGAAGLIEHASVFSTLPEALTGLSRVYATTARERGQNKPVVAPDSEMPLIASYMRQGQGVGVLFGPERTGLTNEDVSLADAVMSFPVNPAFASLNLAQAVLLVGYDWFRHAVVRQQPIGRYLGEPPADRATFLAFLDDLENRLDKAGYFSDTNKKQVMQHNLRNLFHRAALSEQDVKTLRRVVQHLQRS
jgi:tRNA/rRNA methyltransferase